MSAIELSLKIQNTWEKNFPDIPWIAQSINLSAEDFGLNAHHWRIYIQGGGGSYDIQALADSHTIDESLVSIQTSPTDGSIVLNIDPTVMGKLSLKIQQVGIFKSAKLLCFARELNGHEDVVVYNTIDREKELLSILYKHLQANAEPVSKLLLDSLTALIKGSNHSLLASIETSERTKKSAGILKPFLDKYELQYNAHGIKRTFRFWSSSEKAAYLQDVVELMNFLDSVVPGSVALGFGAVLGQVRDQDLIAHDDDLDILVGFDAQSFPTISMGLQCIKSALKNSPWKVEGRFFSHLWVGLPCGKRADIFVGLQEEDGRLSFYPSARYSLHWNDVFPTSTRELCGIKVAMPANPDKYLAKTYGQDWRIPLVGFSHPWDRESYKDIAGISESPIITTRGEVAMKERRNKQY